MSSPIVKVRLSQGYLATPPTLAHQKSKPTLERPTVHIRWQLQNLTCERSAFYDGVVVFDFFDFLAVVFFAGPVVVVLHT